MDDEDALIIGPLSDLDTVRFSDHTIAQVKQAFNQYYEQQRQAIVLAVRQMPSVMGVLDQLTKGKVYEIIIPPELADLIRSGKATLDQSKSGILHATIRDRDSGRIVGQANLREISPEFWPSLSQLAVQRTLADIVQRLEIIDQKVTDILEGQRNDRLATVDSGIHLYQQAIAAADPKTRHQLLIEAVCSLNEGRDQLILSLESDIGALDQRLPRGRWDLFLKALSGDVAKEIEAQVEPVQRSFQAILRASYVLASAYQALDEPKSLEVSLQPLRETLLRVGTRGRQIARWLPYDRARPPEELWGTSLLQLAGEVEATDRALQVVHLKTIGIGFEPSELICGGIDE